MRWNTHREPIQPNSTTAAVICWQEALSGKISTWKCLQSLWMVFKQHANGSLTSCQMCHILYYKAWTKITYALAGRGFPVVMQGKKSWILSNLWHFHSAPGSGLRPHFCTGDSALPQGRVEKEKERAEMETGVRREGYSWLEGGQGSDWMTAIRILIKFNLPPSSFLPHGWQVAGSIMKTDILPYGHRESLL